MKHQKMKLKLLKSREMDRRAEEDSSTHSEIRLPSAARRHFSPDGAVVSVASGEKDFSLRPRQAFLADLKKMSEDQKKYNTGFVTTATYNKIERAKKDRSTIWLSEQLDDLVVGSDPEFGLVDGEGLFVYASRRLEGKHDDKFGTDGPCMEIRAEQSKSVEGHAKNIRKLIEEGSKITILEDLRWWTGATYKSSRQDRRYTLGGHIHIGDPGSINLLTNESENRTTLHKRVIRVLDELVGLPLTKIDSPEPGYRRKTYGAFGDFRSQTNRLEWRTPSAIWLTHPDLAIAVMGTTKAVTEECYLVMSSAEKAPGWISAPASKPSFLKTMGCFTDTVVKRLLNDSKPDSLSNEQLSSLYKRLKKMSTYQKYKAYIDEFTKLTSLTSNDAGKVKLDGMKDNWLAGKALIR